MPFDGGKGPYVGLLSKDSIAGQSAIVLDMLEFFFDGGAGDWLAKAAIVQSCCGSACRRLREGREMRLAGSRS